VRTSKMELAVTQKMGLSFQCIIVCSEVPHLWRR